MSKKKTTTAATHKVVKNKLTGDFELIETSTDFILKRGADHEEVYKYYRFVKGGGAFAGSTPPFMMIDLSTVKMTR